jgi:predicted GH43/DUF377 family glycosyl hydrolase
MRHCQYTFYHSEKKKFEHEYGPLLYLNPENDITLTTTNYLCKLDNNLRIKEYNKVDTSKLDVRPIWEFVGLEDARLFRWDDHLYLSGVRRDTTPNGVGRMELSELDTTNGVKEISRFRIPAPGTDNTYCEKNWMPILDMPYHYVKWSNPTEVVRVDPDKKTCETVYHGSYVQKPRDYRGSSQVINVGNYRMALTHTVDLFKSEAGKKDAVYRHAFVVWDLNWNVLKYTSEFSFMGADVEFCCGMAAYKNDILITFGCQDNAAYVLRVPSKFIEDYINAN